MRLRISVLAVWVTLAICACSGDPEPVTAQPDAGLTEAKDVPAQTETEQDIIAVLDVADVTGDDIEAPSDDGALETTDEGEPEDAEDLDDVEAPPDDEATPDDVPDAPPDGDDGPSPCNGPCDCPQGHACVDSGCALGEAPVFCCDQEGCPGGDACVSDAGVSSVCGAVLSPAAGILLFNEVLIDGAVSGDPNGDGDAGDAVGDEFVEIVNTGETELALDGFTLEETTFAGLPRHTFDAGTTIGPGKAIVIFGGGSPPDDVAGTHFEVANAADVGIAFGLALDDTGDALSLLDAEGHLVAVFAWGAGAPNAPLSDRSYTRAPDLFGPFVPHDEAQPDTLYSPGTKTDASTF